VLNDSENGYFVNDEVDLAAKIIQILENDKQRAQMGTKSHEIASKFDWEKIAKKIIIEYEDVKSRF